MSLLPQIPQWDNVLCKACGVTSCQLPLLVLRVLAPQVLVPQVLVPQVLVLLVPQVDQEYSY